jgi:hypothetical protein
MSLCGTIADCLDNLEGTRHRLNTNARTNLLWMSAPRSGELGCILQMYVYLIGGRRSMRMYVQVSFVVSPRNKKLIRYRNVNMQVNRKITRQI